MGNRSLVAVVDDSESVRESLPDLLQQVGFAVHAFASAEAFLGSDAADETRCSILDVGLPGMSGPDLQQELLRRGKAIPIVFITAQGEKSLHPRLIAAGAAVPVQAIQRHGVARCGRGCTRDEVTIKA